MVGVILVVRPPFLFPKHTVHLQIQENNQTFLAQDYSLNDEDIHWIGVAICFAASCIGGLINVSIRYLKVSSRFWTNILKFMFSKKATKIDVIFTADLTLEGVS